MAKVSKAQKGKKVVDSVPSEMNPGKMIPKSAVTKDGKITKADILKGRGVIKNGGKMKAKSGMKMGKCKYGC